MAMAMTNNNGDRNGDGDGNSNHNFYATARATATAMATMTLTKTDTREGCLFMCRKCAVLWQGRRLASPPWAQKECALPSAVPSGCHCKECLLHFKGEGSWELTMDCFFIIFFNYLVSLLDNPLFPHINSVPQEPRQPINGPPQLLLYFLSR